MVEKTIMCPNCKNKLTIQGNPGEKIYITCPKCDTKGKFTFPGGKTPLETVDTSSSLEVTGLTKTFNGFKAVDNI